MAHAFKRTPDGYRARFEPAEVELIRDLAEDIIDLLTPAPASDPLEAMLGITEDTSTPNDPALARLLPVASSHEEAATEYRRYVDADIRAHKIANLRMLATDVESGRHTLDETHARAWANALGDIRLVLAERLNLRTEADNERVNRLMSSESIDNAEEYLAYVYGFFGWLQDTLMESMLESLDEEQGEEPGMRPWISAAEEAAQEPVGAVDTSEPAPTADTTPAESDENPEGERR